MTTAPSKPRRARLSDRKRVALFPMRRAGPQQTLRTLALKLRITRQRLHQIILELEESGIRLPSWASRKARAKRQGRA